MRTPVRRYVTEPGPRGRLRMNIRRLSRYARAMALLAILLAAMALCAVWQAERISRAQDRWDTRTVVR